MQELSYGIAASPSDTTRQVTRRQQRCSELVGRTSRQAVENADAVLTASHSPVSPWSRSSTRSRRYKRFRQPRRCADSDLALSRIKQADHVLLCDHVVADNARLVLVLSKAVMAICHGCEPNCDNLTEFRHLTTFSYLYDSPNACRTDGEC